MNKYCRVPILVIISVVIHAFGHIAIASKEIGNLEDLIVDIQINYEQSIESVFVLEKDNDILVPYDLVLSFHVKESYLDPAKMTMNGREYISLTKLRSTNYHLDRANLYLSIIFPPEAMVKQKLDLIQSESEKSMQEYIEEANSIELDQPSQGAFINYDLTLTKTQFSRNAVGLYDFNYALNQGVFNQTFITRLTNDKRFKKENDITRLDTSFIINNENQTTAIKIGDNISKAADWSGATRFIGIQYSSNFSMRPDLITFPLLDYTNTATLPSSIDVYANQIKLSTQNVKTGEFDLSNIPLPTGKGDLIIRAKDITGKEQTLVVPYYIVPQLLKPGLSDFSLSFGRQRYGYGVRQNSYKDYVSSADYRHGINNNFTNSIHFESMKIASVGDTIYYKLGNIGVINTSVATNLKSNMHNSYKLSAGFDYSDDIYFFNTGLSYSASNFIETFDNQVTSRTGPSLQSSVGCSSEKYGTLSLGYLSYTINQQDNGKSKLKFITANYDKDLDKNFNLRFSTGKTIKGPSNFYALLSLSVNLDKNKYATISASRQRRQSDSYELSYLSPVDGNIGWGHKTFLKKSHSDNRYDLEISNHGPKVNTTLFLFGDKNSSTQQVTFDGAIVGIDKSLYFTQPIFSSYALVKTIKVKDVPVYSNNQLITYTDSNGKALVPNIPAYTRSKIALDDSKIPFDSSLSTSKIIVEPKWKSGAIANFDVQLTKSVQMSLVDNNKHWVPLNSDVYIDGLIDDDLFIGYNGALFIKHIKDLKTIKGKACHENDCCSFEVDIPISNEIIDLGEVLCRK